jgi:hypothetical protein
MSLKRVASLFSLFGLSALFGVSPSSAEDRSLILLSPQFPHIYQLSYEKLKRANGFSWGVGSGFVPPLKFDASGTQVTVGMFHGEAHGRYHPFGGGFFLGAALGYQSVPASGEQTIDIGGGINVPTKASTTLKNAYATPMLGWLWATDYGLSIGFEGGMQFGFMSSNTLGIEITDATLQQYQATVESTTAYQELRASVQDGLNKIGNTKIFHFALRLGWAL